MGWTAPAFRRRESQVYWRTCENPAGEAPGFAGHIDALISTLRQGDILHGSMQVDYVLSQPLRMTNSMSNFFSKEKDESATVDATAIEYGPLAAYIVYWILVLFTLMTRENAWGKLKRVADAQMQQQQDTLPEPEVLEILDEEAPATALTSTGSTTTGEESSGTGGGDGSQEIDAKPKKKKN